MKKLSQFINESLHEAKDSALDDRFKVFVPEWETFKKAAIQAGFETLTDENGLEVVHHKGTVLVRFDDDALEVYSDVTKRDFFDIVLRSKTQLLKKYIKK